MGDKNLEEDVSVHKSLETSNAIVNSTDLSNYLSKSSELKDYFNVLSALSDDCSVVEVNAEKISTDFSSEKIEKPKIWSIVDILGNSTDQCSNEISSNPVGEISDDEPNYGSDHSRIENQEVPSNDNFNKSNLDDNNFIANQTLHLNVSKPNFEPALTPSYDLSIRQLNFGSTVPPPSSNLQVQLYTSEPNFEPDLILSQSELNADSPNFESAFTPFMPAQLNTSKSNFEPAFTPVQSQLNISQPSFGPDFTPFQSQFNISKPNFEPDFVPLQPQLNISQTSFEPAFAPLQSQLNISKPNFEPDFIPLQPQLSFEPAFVLLQSQLNISQSSFGPVFIPLQSQLDLNKPNFEPASTPSRSEMEWPSLPASVTKHRWLINGKEFYYIEADFNCNNSQCYLCGNCGLRFSDKKTLYRHQCDAHLTNKNDCHCRFCGQIFESLRSLLVHVNMFHYNLCAFCGVQFEDDISLMQHVIYCHP